MSRPPLAVEALEPRELPAAPFPTLPVFPAADPAVVDVARSVIVRGATLGRRVDSFMKVGDSNSDPGYGAGYLYPMGAPGYNAAADLAAYPHLHDTLAAYRTPAGTTGSNSFGRVSPVAVAGARATTVLHGLAAEVAATNAGVALVMIGTNDVTAQTGLAQFRVDLSELVRRLAGAGVVPVLSTVPDATAFGPAHADAVNGYNQVIADVAADFRVPLLNTWRAFLDVPNRGLGTDGLHVSAAGQNVRSVLALQVLDWFREQVATAAPVDRAPRPWAPLAPGQAVFAVGRGEGQAPVVTAYDAAGAEVERFLAFEPSFSGGVRVATADVTGDGVPDVVVGAGLGGAPAVKVFNGADGSQAASFFAFESSFRSGVHVAAADLDGDGVAEVVAGAGDGGGPAVAVFRGGDFAEVARFFAYESSFRGGVSVAAGDVAGVGPAIVTGAGVGGGPVVKVFRLGDDRQVFSYLVYDARVRSGITVAVVNGEVATAPAAGAPHVKLTDAATGAARASFFAPATGEGGVRLGALRDESGDVLLTAGGPGSASRTYRGENGEPFGLNEPTRGYGVYVG